MISVDGSRHLVVKKQGGSIFFEIGMNFGEVNVVTDPFSPTRGSYKVWCIKTPMNPMPYTSDTSAKTIYIFNKEGGTTEYNLAVTPYISGTQLTLTIQINSVDLNLGLGNINKGIINLD